MIENYVDFLDKFYSEVLKAWQLPEIEKVAPKKAICFQNKEEAKISSDSTLLRVFVQTVDENQATIATCVGSPFTRRFKIIGFAILEIFVPKDGLNAHLNAAVMAQTLKNHFRQAYWKGHIAYRSVRINELEAENLFIRYNVIVEFEYFEKG